jgi:hypothetical protein
LILIRKDLSEKVIRGRTENVLKCKFNGGTLPIGYITDEEQHFQIEPLTAPFVLDVFKKYDKGATMKELRDWLNENGIRNKLGKPLNFNSIQHMLSNRRYIGEYKYRDIVVPDGIPVIVPEDLFDRVQEKLAQNRKAPARHKAEDDYLLTTKLFCGYCGAYLCGESGKSRNGTVHHYYKCVSVKKKRTDCKKKPVRKQWLEDLVVNEVMKVVMDDQTIEAIATHVNHDCASLNRTIMTLLTNRLGTRTGNRLVKKGRELTAFEKARFGKSKMIRYVAGTNEPIYPIGYTQHKNPLFRKKSWNYYTPEGREGIHDCLRINVSMMLALMRMPTYSNSAEYADNRISLFSAQWGKCAVTGDEFSHIGEIHCHHKLPRHLGGDDSYGNLVLIKDAVHKLIHASNTETIHKYMDLLQLDSKRLAKVNNLRQLASMQPI